MLHSLLTSWTWTVDLIFVLVLVAGTAFGAYRGLISGVCKMAGTLFAIVFAVIFCVSFSNFLEQVFHMTTAIANGLTNSFKNEALLTPLPADFSGADIKSTLEALNVGWLPRSIISGAFASVETIPAGTTPAMMLGSVLAKWFSIAISFVLLVVLIKLAAVLLDKGLSGLVERVAPFRVINQLLGAILGLLKAGILLFIVLAVCSWIPLEGMHNFLSSSAIVGPIFRSEWFAAATNYAISGQWFDDYIAQFIF